MPPRVPAMRYHNRLSMKRRPQPSCGNLGCETSIEDPIRERSNITISIVKLLASIPPDHRWERKAKGWFLEFRLIPVLLWSYTAAPVSTSYRPFAGEWLGGFPGVLLSGLGAYAIQTLSVSLVATTALVAHALVCTAMLVVHHYLDEPMDAGATPPKRTTVVALGYTTARRYAGIMAGIAAALYAILGAIVHPAFFLGAIFTV